MKPYPMGIELIEHAACPAGAVFPMACMYCSCGHMTECHYPCTCEEAECGHLLQESGCPEEGWYEESGYPNVESYNLDAFCEVCGCTELQACPGGCAWSERYLARARYICTNCESLVIMFEVNMAALRIWRRGAYIQKERAV
jgi:hypothetical protein